KTWAGQWNVRHRRQTFARRRLSVRRQVRRLTDASDVLLQQINRGGQKDNILHQERDVAGHRGKSGNRIPAVRHERNDRDRGEESHGRTGGAKDAQPLVPEACEQQRTEGPLGDAQEPAGALQAKCGIKPPDQWTVADERNESLRFVCPPFLVTEGQEDDHHRRADDVVIEILREQAEPAQDADKRIECGVDDRVHCRNRPLTLRPKQSLYAAAGKSISVWLMRLKTLVKMIVAKARLMSTSCASVYPAALIAAKSSSLTVPLVSASVRTKRTSASRLVSPVGWPSWIFLSSSGFSPASLPSRLCAAKQ